MDGSQGSLFEGASIASVIPDWNAVPEDLSDVEIPVSGEVNLEQRWELICDLAFEVSPAIACVLEQARVHDEGDHVTVLMGKRFLVAVGTEALQAFVSSLDRTIFLRGPEFTVEEDTEKTGSESEVNARRRARVYTDKQVQMRKKMLNHPVIARAIELFNPDEVDVRVWVNPDAIRG